MQIAVFSTKRHDRAFFEAANDQFHHELVFLEARLTPESVSLARGYPVISIFVNDLLDSLMISDLASHGLRLVALRSAGYNHVDISAADQHRVHVSRVPAYSPASVAEHTVTLILALNRKVHRAYARVREGNFALDGLLGTEVHRKTLGIIGTGRIGAEVARIMAGFGCRLLGHDLSTNPDCEAYGVEYVSLPELLFEADIVTLHCPLTPDTHHLIDNSAVRSMKPGVMLINTSRGALVDTQAVIDGLKDGTIGSLGLDTYEEEADLFYENLSDVIIKDDTFARLLTFPNVLITGHQGFFTHEALEAISETTLSNVDAFARGDLCQNAVTTWGRTTCQEGDRAA